MKMMKEADEARTNVVKLEVYFEELNYQSIMETPAMDIFDLLSNIGGTLGLYVGMSFLTLGEFFELFLKCLAVAPKAKLRSRASMDEL
uniref:Amiloride-sensitive sodium channel subunit alpha n=1 Tax=Steinernema glaseri TaxID=37863 RepID=A0A1I7ZP24_9BILA